jgi:hypothetical protein
MTNDEQEPATQPGSEPIGGVWEKDPWIIVDDTEDAAEGSSATSPSAGAGAASEATAPEPPPAASQSRGWDSFATGESWNGMPVAPPGARSGAASGAWGTSGARFETEPGGGDEAGTTSRAEPGSTREAPADSTGRNGSTDRAQGTWFIDDGDDDYLDDASDDSAGDSVRWTLTDRLPRLGTPSFGPGFVTFAVICVSVLLVISSIIWHPQAP